MKQLNNFITEKLQIGKNTNVETDAPESIQAFADKYAFRLAKDKENNYINGKMQLLDHYYLDYSFRDRNNNIEQKEQYKKFYYAFVQLDGHIDKAMHNFVQDNQTKYDDINYITTYSNGGRNARIELLNNSDELYGVIHLYPSHLNIMMQDDEYEKLNAHVLDYLIKYYNEN